MYRQHYPNDPGMHNMPPPPQRSFWERIKRSFVAIFVGLILISVATGILFWNEGRSVQTARSLDEGMRLVRQLHNTEVIFDENNEKLVHVTAALKTSKALFDETYNIAVPAVKLKRKVEMYQWVEQELKREVRDGDETREEITYSYSEEWRAELIRSSSFNTRLYSNPEEFIIDSKIYIAEDAQIGNFFLSRSLVDRITNFKHLKISKPKEPPQDPNLKLHNGAFYHSDNPQNPVIGDTRVIFEYAGLSGKDTSRLGPPDVVSIIARQMANKLEVFHTEAGDEIEFLYLGEYSPEQMINREHASNAMLLWALRFVGWLLAFIGFQCLTHLFLVLVDYLPVVRDLVSLGMGTLCATLSISLSLTVIAMGWIWYRPSLGLTILFLACLPFAVSKWRLMRVHGHRSL